VSYVKRVVDDRIFEVFGAETHQRLVGRDIVSMAYFFIYDAEVTEDDEGALCDGLWCWRPCTDFLPLEIIEPEDIEEDDEHLSIPSPEPLEDTGKVKEDQL